MPIYLAPWSRRRFLQSAVAAAAGLLAGCGTPGRAHRRDPSAFALFADTHIHTDPSQTARGITMSWNLEQAAQEVLATEPRVARVLIAGDLAYNSGQAGDYQQLAALLRPLLEHGYPVHLALGNHDNRDRFWAEFKAARAAKRPLRDRQSVLLSSPHANWFILDSLEKTNSTAGLLGPEQLSWLAETLDANLNKPAIVMLHHNPGIQENMGLKDTMPLLDVIRPRKQVKAYVYGHTHTWKVLQDSSGIHLINLPPVAYTFQKTDPAGWVYAKLRPDSIRLELRCLDHAHPNHGEVQDLAWRV